MLKAVIFDMDGVLIDSEPLHAKAAVMALKRFGISISIDYCYQFIGTTTRHMYETVIETYHPQASLDELIQADHECKDYLIRTEGYPAIPYICRLVREIRAAGLLTAVASSSTMEEIRLERRRCFRNGRSGRKRYLPQLRDSRRMQQYLV